MATVVVVPVRTREKLKPTSMRNKSLKGHELTATATLYQLVTYSPTYEIALLAVGCDRIKRKVRKGIEQYQYSDITNPAGIYTLWYTHVKELGGCVTVNDIIPGILWNQRVITCALDS